MVGTEETGDSEAAEDLVNSVALASSRVQRAMNAQGVKISQPALRARPATLRSALTTIIRSGFCVRRARRTIQSSADSTNRL